MWPQPDTRLVLLVSIGFPKHWRLLKVLGHPAWPQQGFAATKQDSK